MKYQGYEVNFSHPTAPKGYHKMPDGTIQKNPIVIFGNGWELMLLVMQVQTLKVHGEIIQMQLFLYQIQTEVIFLD